MPSTATTTVTIGTLLDLIGPGAPLPQSDSDSSAFDSLLQSPTAPPSPPSASDSTSTNQKSTSTNRADNSAQRPDPSTPQYCSDGQNDDPTGNSGQTQQNSTQNAAATEKETSSNPKSHSSKSNSSTNDQQAQAAEDVIAESLAGLAAVVPVTTPAAPADVATEGKETPDTESLNPKAAVTKPVTPAVAAKVQPTPGNPAAIDTETQASQEPTGSGAKVVAASTIQVSATAKSINKSNTDAPQEEKSSPTASVNSLDQLSDEPGETRVDATQELPQPAHDQRPASSNDNQAAPPLDPGSALPQLADSGATPAASDLSAALPAATTTPTVDVSPSITTATETNPITSAAPQQRSRLPAELLSQTANTQTRHPSVEIDATRLLNRVARAFTAAQERDGEIRLRLSPPELGSLRLDVRVQDGVLVARLQTETDAARTAIIDNLPALRDRLSEQGVRIERFDVDLMQRQPGGMPDQPGGRQQELPPARINVLAPPRRQTEAPATTGPTIPTIGSADGLNVVV